MSFSSKKYLVFITQKLALEHDRFRVKSITIKGKRLLRSKVRNERILRANKSIHLEFAMQQHPSNIVPLLEFHAQQYVFY